MNGLITGSERRRNTVWYGDEWNWGLGLKKLLREIEGINDCSAARGAPVAHSFPWHYGFVMAFPESRFQPSGGAASVPQKPEPPHRTPSESVSPLWRFCHKLKLGFSVNLWQTKMNGEVKLKECMILMNCFTATIWPKMLVCFFFFVLSLLHSSFTQNSETTAKW